MNDNESIKLVELISTLKDSGASEKKIKWSYDRFLEMKARNSKTPLHGTFELTPLCNLDCKMCYVHLSFEQFSPKNLLPVEFWKKMITEAHSSGMLYATLTGGECLTYPGFDEIYAYLYNMGIVPCVMSNGLLIDEERIAFFKKLPPYIIQVSLYGSSEEAYEDVTGKRVFHTIYHNLERLRDSNLRVSLVITPSSFMQEDIQSLLEVAKSLKIPYNINASLFVPRENTGRKLQDLEIDQYMKIYRIMKEQNQENLNPIDSIELPEENHNGQPQFGLRCGGGTSGFNIQYDGKMTPCASLCELYTEPSKLGFGSAWCKLNKLVSKYPFPSECVGCSYYDYCILCPKIHNNAHNPGHRDPRICERTKRLIQEGYFHFQSKENRSSFAE